MTAALHASISIPSRTIRRRTLGRWMVDPDPRFPKPLTMNGRHYLDLAEIEAHEKRSAVQVAAA